VHFYGRLKLKRIPPQRYREKLFYCKNIK